MLKYNTRITLWMIRIMEGWLERLDGEWEVVDVTPKNEEIEPCNSSLPYEDCEENDQEKNEGELKNENASVASWDQQVQRSSVSHVNGRVLRSSARASRGSHQSVTAEPGVESAGKTPTPQWWEHRRIEQIPECVAED